MKRTHSILGSVLAAVLLLGLMAVPATSLEEEYDPRGGEGNELELGECENLLTKYKRVHRTGWLKESPGEEWEVFDEKTATITIPKKETYKEYKFKRHETTYEWVKEETHYRWHRNFEGPKEVQGVEYVDGAWVVHDDGNWYPVPSHLNPPNNLVVGQTGSFSGPNKPYGLPNPPGTINWRYQGGEEWWPSPDGFAPSLDGAGDGAWGNPVAQQEVTVDGPVRQTDSPGDGWTKVEDSEQTETIKTGWLEEAPDDGHEWEVWKKRTSKRTIFIEKTITLYRFKMTEISDWYADGERPRGKGWKVYDRKGDDTECSGNFEVEKIVEGNPSGEPVFEFEVTCADETISFTLEHGQTWESPELTSGIECTVEETDRQGADTVLVDGDEGTSTEVTVPVDETATVVFTNVFDPPSNGGGGNGGGNGGTPSDDPEVDSVQLEATVEVLAETIEEDEEALRPTRVDAGTGGNLPTTGLAGLTALLLAGLGLTIGGLRVRRIKVWTKA